MRLNEVVYELAFVIIMNWTVFLLLLMCKGSFALISQVHFSSRERAQAVCLCQQFSCEICILSLFSFSWHFHFPFALPIIFDGYFLIFSLYSMCSFLLFHYSSLHFLSPISSWFPSCLQRRCRNCRSTLLCWGRSMWRCNRSWWRRRGGAPCWLHRPLSLALPPRPVTPSSAACWPSWLTSFSKSSTGENWTWTCSHILLDEMSGES